jgi:hypothetical protein
MITTATRWNFSHSRRDASRDNGAPLTAPAPSSASITPLSRFATQSGALGTSGLYSGSAPERAPRTTGPEQDDLDDVDDAQVSVTRLAPDLPAPRLELLHYHVGTRRPIPRDTASNGIVATHSMVRVASLDATAAALARRGTPLAGHDL